MQKEKFTEVKFRHTDLLIRIIFQQITDSRLSQALKDKIKSVWEVIDREFLINEIVDLETAQIVGNYVLRTLDTEAHPILDIKIRYK